MKAVISRWCANCAQPGSTSSRLSRKRPEGRILLTEDRDFGRLVFAATRATSGVIFIRFPAARRAELAGKILDLVRREGDRRDVVLQRIAKHDAALRETFAALEVLDYRHSFEECVTLVKRAFGER